jgi:hypothetical protein
MWLMQPIRHCIVEKEKGMEYPAALAISYQAIRWLFNCCKSIAKLF